MFNATNDRPCNTMLPTPDGKAMVCGGNGSCPKGQPDVTAYSVATGKPEAILYQGSCNLPGSAQVMWAGSDTLAIGAIDVGSASKNVVGLMTPGKFTPLPLPSPATDDTFGWIAF